MRRTSMAQAHAVRIGQRPKTCEARLSAYILPQAKMLACNGIFAPHVNGAGARGAHRATPKDLRNKAFCVYYNTFSNFFKVFLNFFGKNNWFFRHNPPKRKLFLVRALILCFCDLFFKAFFEKIHNSFSCYHHRICRRAACYAYMFARRFKILRKSKSACGTNVSLPSAVESGTACRDGEIGLYF